MLLCCCARNVPVAAVSGRPCAFDLFSRDVNSYSLLLLFLPTAAAYDILGRRDGIYNLF